MKSRRITFYFFIFLLLFTSSCSYQTPYPNDELLEQKFYANEPSFEKLIKMFEEDSTLFQVSLEKGAFESFEKIANLTENRLAEYNKILSKLDIEFIERYENQEDIYLKVWSNPNFFIGGKSKYYFYSERDITNTVNSLDEIYRNGRDANQMKKISGNWYLYLDVW